MASFKITGKPLLHKFWNWKLNRAQRKIKKYEDTSIDVSNVIMPTPSTLIIKFTNLNKNKKFELVIQGNYSKLYKETKDVDLMKVPDINVEEIIRSRISEAYIINE